MTTNLSHACCDQRQNGRPLITWYTTISEMTSTCSTTTQDEQVSPSQPLMKTLRTKEHHLSHPSLTNKLPNELQLQEPHSCLCNSNHQSTAGQKVCHNQKASQEECNIGDKVLQPSFTQPCQTTSDCLPKNSLPCWTDPHWIMDMPTSKPRMQRARLH